MRYIIIFSTCFFLFHLIVVAIPIFKSSGFADAEAMWLLIFDFPFVILQEFTNDSSEEIAVAGTLSWGLVGGLLGAFYDSRRKKIKDKNNKNNII